MKRIFPLLAACLLPATRAAEPEPPADAVDFIRVVEEESATRLQTSISRYVKDGVNLDLIGAIHIADATYYETLNQRFEGYEALLFEGIGGGNPGPPPAADEAPPRRLEGLHAIYDKSARWLELSYQMSEIDYTKPNFVHADLSFDEFAGLQAERKESLLGFMLRASVTAEPSKVKEPSTLGLLKALVRRDGRALKLELVHTLGAGDDQIASISGESVIITDRNVKCLEVLDQQIAAGKTRLGIFYGAAHFPDMEKRLLDQGWTKDGEEWLTAWDIGK